MAEYDNNVPDNPLRPPDWRWLAGKDLPLNAPYPEWADEWVYYSRQLIDEFKNNRAKGKVLGKTGALSEAFQLYTAIKQQSGFSQLSGFALSAAELEGYILADRPVEEIADDVGLTTDTIQWYERLFFDVRERLNKVSWVASVVVGAVYGSTLESLIPTLARAYGYYTKDPVLVKVFLRGMDSAGVKAAAEHAGPLQALQHDTRVALAVKAGLVCRMVEPSSKAFRSVMEMYARITELANQAGETDDGQAKFKEATNVLLGAMDWDTGTPKALKPKPTEVSDDD